VRLSSSFSSQSLTHIYPSSRETPAAKIFEMKSEEDFRHSLVVTRLFKTLAWIFVILLNCCFIFFTMLRGLQRGDTWQRLYAIACLLQLVVEVIFYETTECIVMNFLIPDLVRKEVQSVGFSLRQTIQKISSSSLTSSKLCGVLDAPSYLFVSTSVAHHSLSSSHCLLLPRLALLCSSLSNVRNVAKHFPNSLSSLIVRSYHTPSPGEIARKWKTSSSTYSAWSTASSRSNHRRMRRFVLTTFLFTALQRLGSLSPSLQRVFIHLVQPISLGGLFYVGVLLTAHPLSFIGVGALLVALIVSLVNSIRRDRQEEEAGLSDIVPQTSSLDQLFPNPTLPLPPPPPLHHPVPLPSPVVPEEVESSPEVGSPSHVESEHSLGASGEIEESQWRRSSSLSDEDHSSSHSSSSSLHSFRHNFHDSDSGGPSSDHYAHRIDPSDRSDGLSGNLSSAEEGRDLYRPSDLPEAL
jgi:hypothetical protein